MKSVLFYFTNFFGPVNTLSQKPLGPLNAAESEPFIFDGIRYPPYLVSILSLLTRSYAIRIIFSQQCLFLFPQVPGSSWEKEWRESHPQGWNLLSDVKRLVSDGDKEIFEYAIAHDKSLAHGTDQWKPVSFNFFR